MRVAEAIAIAAVVRAAEEGGVFAALEAGPRRLGELADALGLPQRSLALAADALVAAEVLRREGDTLALGPEVGSPSLSLGDEARLWAHAPAWLRSGAALESADTPATAATYRRVVPGLASLWGDAPARLAAALPLAPARILDLGCGAGPWSLALAERHPGARVTGLDLPGVEGQFTRAATARGLGDRARAVGGDLDALPAAPEEPFDLVVLANVLRLDRSAARGRVRGAVRQLAPGGALLIVDALAGGTPEADRARTLYAVHLALRRPDGALPDGESLGAWLAEEGLPHALRLPLAPCPGALEARLFSALPLAGCA